MSSAIQARDSALDEQGVHAFGIQGLHDMNIGRVATHVIVVYDRLPACMLTVQLDGDEELADSARIKPGCSVTAIASGSGSK